MPRRSLRLAAKRSSKKRKREEFDDGDSEYVPESSPEPQAESESESDPSESDCPVSEESDIDSESSVQSNCEGVSTEQIEGLEQYRHSSSEPPMKKRKVSKTSQKPNSSERPCTKRKHSFRSKKSDPYSVKTGGGFSTKAKALRTLEFIKGRDIRYQVNMVSSFLCGGRWLLKKHASTPEKAKDVNEAIAVFEEWMVGYEGDRESLQTFDHLALDVMNKFVALVRYYNSSKRKKEETESGFSSTQEVFDVDKRFLDVFASLRGEIRALRVTDTEIEGQEAVSWDIHRNTRLLDLKSDLMKQDIRCNGSMKDLDDSTLFYKRGKLKGLPSRLHLQMIMLGYSPRKPVINKLSKTLHKALANIAKATKL